MKDDEFIMSLRLPAEVADELGMVSKLDDVSRSEAVRDAITNHLAARRADPEFQRRLRERIAADQAILDRLTKGAS